MHILGDLDAQTMCMATIRIEDRDIPMYRQTYADEFILFINIADSVTGNKEAAAQMKKCFLKDDRGFLRLP